MTLKPLVVFVILYLIFIFFGNNVMREKLNLGGRLLINSELYNSTVVIIYACSTCRAYFVSLYYNN